MSKEMVLKMGARSLLGIHIEGYGCPGKSAVEYGLACMELEARDSRLRLLVSAQGPLTMSVVNKFGSEEHKQERVPKMAKGKATRSAAFWCPRADPDSAPRKQSTRLRYAPRSSAISSRKTYGSSPKDATLPDAKGHQGLSRASTRPATASSGARWGRRRIAASALSSLRKSSSSSASLSPASSSPRGSS